MTERLCECGQPENSIRHSFATATSVDAHEFKLAASLPQPREIGMNSLLAALMSFVRITCGEWYCWCGACCPPSSDALSVGRRASAHCIQAQEAVEAASLPVDRGAPPRDRMLELLNKAIGVLQNLDLESDYYIDGSRHPVVKKMVTDCLTELCTEVACDASVEPGAAQPDLEAIALKWFPASYQGTSREFCLAAMREALQLPSRNMDKVRAGMRALADSADGWKAKAEKAEAELASREEVRSREGELLRAVIDGLYAVEDEKACAICRPSPDDRHEETCPVLIAERFLQTSAPPAQTPQHTSVCSSGLGVRIDCDCGAESAPEAEVKASAREVKSATENGA